MLTLLTYPRNDTAFSLSPFCVKAALLLTYAGVSWQREDLNDPRKMPHGKLPVLRTPERLIADSTEIRLWLEAQETDFDTDLSQSEQAQAQALIRMAEDSLYFHIVYDRWANDKAWPVIRDTYFTDIPALIRRPVASGIRRSVLKGLGFQGTGRFSNEQRAARLEQDLDALRTQLEGRSFLMGDKVTSVDFSVAPMLQAMCGTPAATALVTLIKEDSVLCSYVDRVFKVVPV
jgi:glutathione S-transferase